MSLIHSRNTLINDFYEFLMSNSSFQQTDIDNIIQLLKEYSLSNNKEMDKKIFLNYKKLCSRILQVNQNIH